MSIGTYRSTLVLNEPAETDGLGRETSAATEVFNDGVHAQDEPLRRTLEEGGVEEVGQIRVFPKRGADVTGLEPGYVGTLTWPEGDSETVVVRDVRRIDGRMALDRR